MKKHSAFFVWCLVSLFAAVTAFAQQGPAGQFGYGFTGPQGASGQYGYGFTGPSQIVPVAQAQTYGHRSPVIIQGNIVQALGGDLYIFRDSTGEIVLRIGPREWQYYGTTISPSDTIEISGEVHRRNWQQPEVHARFIRKL
ncbi:MAG: NirD/YgiW/YdeI family stress tolerance protein [Treponema sp.]|jgi:uncharacterized protein (TIGR00156 family)|nr:NirD/YgiW/YdeI family stress tolerance protein [Treponema sp.]